MKKTVFPYRAFEQFVLRTPLLPVQFYLRLTSKSDISDRSIKEVYTNAIIKEAIFLASPTLYFELEKWVKGDLEQKKEQRVKLSLLKYISRMCSRCTPFGLFAGCTVGSLSENTILEIGNPKEHRRFTRPDMNYLVALAQDLAKEKHIKKQLIYFPNSSLYRVGEKLRYIEYFYVDSRRQHHIVEIDDSTYLQKVLSSASRGASLQRMAEQLIDNTISPEDAYEFLDELLESQVLTSNLEPSVSGPPFVEQILKILESLKGCDSEIKFLKEISKRFETLDGKLGNNPNFYLELSSFLKELPTNFELKYLFQTDLEPQSNTCILSKNHVSQIKKALKLFNQITPFTEENNLSQFRDSFYERYEDREMPLAHVLDVETGIGYIQNMGSGDLNPLIDDLVIPQEVQPFQERKTKLNRVNQILLSKLIKAQKEKEKIIHLQESDFKDLPENWNDLPNTLSTLVRLVRENDEDKICISGSGGSSGANLLGRFCHEKSNLTPLAKNIIAKEKEMEVDKILAEIVHLPEARVGNILMRPNFREFEIPYLAESILPIENRLPIEDLYLSIRENRVFLRSKKLNKEVVPRLTNAHNFASNSLPIYHFLADLQTQGLRNGIYFSFGPIDEMVDFLPRVEYENLILKEARWRFHKTEFEKFLHIKAQKKQLMEKFRIFKREKDLPQFVLLVDGDNELLINLKNYTSVLMLLETIKNRFQFILKEFLHHQDGVVYSDKGYFTNQVMVAFYNDKKISHVNQFNEDTNDTA